MKLVSVIIPVYGVEKYIENTIRSALNQTYANTELLIVDDESPDRSVEICQQFTDPRIKIICQRNRGLAGARNTGIRHARGDYLAFLDADDLWLPEKLEKHVAHLEDSPAIGASFSRSAFIDEQGTPLGIYQISKIEGVTPLDILCRAPIGNGSAAVFRREVLAAIKFQDDRYGAVEDFYFDEQFRESEDIECWVRIAIQTNWQFAGIPEALTLYRVNSGGLSANLSKKLKSWEALIDKIRSYAPEQIVQWEKPAMAYQLRYLARRAVTMRAGDAAVELFHRALVTYWQIALEEPSRTLLTGAAVYLVKLLPQATYNQIQDLALRVTGTAQRRQILQDQSRQTVRATPNELVV